MEWDFLALQQGHEVWTRHVEQVGGLLGRQLRVDWYDRDGAALTHLNKEVGQEAGDGFRKREFVAIFKAYV